MSNFETLPIREYIVKNEDTGITFHMLDFADAEDCLLMLRNENKEDCFIMYAVVDA